MGNLISMADAVAEIKNLKAELAAQEVSRQTYYSEWEERAKKQQVVINALKSKMFTIKGLLKTLEGAIND